MWFGDGPLIYPPSAQFLAPPPTTTILSQVHVVSAFNSEPEQLYQEVYRYRLVYLRMGGLLRATQTWGKLTIALGTAYSVHLSSATGGISWAHLPRIVTLGRDHVHIICMWTKLLWVDIYNCPAVLAIMIFCCSHVSGFYNVSIPSPTVIAESWEKEV